MASSKPDNILRLKDGRLLGYAEYSDPEGKPGFYFHGMPGSRLEARLSDAVGKKLGARVIAIDRPGYGLSDFKPGRTLLDWPSDVVELADALNIDRFAVAGVSGGGPYAAVCALRIPERLLAAGIISSVGPFDAPGATEGMASWNRLVFGLARRVPWLVTVPDWLIQQVAQRFPDRFISMFIAALPDSDQAVLTRPEIRAIFGQDVAEAFRSGSRGWACDQAIFARPWGFRLEDIAMDMFLWQGEDDRNVPPSMGRYLTRAIPNCHATFYPGEGHFLIIDHLEEILSTLLSSATANTN